MPIFEFVCKDCGWEFEELVRSASNVEEVICPACDSGYVLKQISTFASKISGGSLASSFASGPSCNTGST